MRRRRGVHQVQRHVVVDAQQREQGAAGVGPLRRERPGGAGTGGAPPPVGVACHVQLHPVGGGAGNGDEPTPVRARLGRTHQVAGLVVHVDDDTRDGLAALTQVAL